MEAGGADAAAGAGQPGDRLVRIDRGVLAPGRDPRLFLGLDLGNPEQVTFTVTSDGTSPLAFHAINCGASRLQCGHQCARNTSITGPCEGSTTTGLPSKSYPP